MEKPPSGHRDTLIAALMGVDRSFEPQRDQGLLGAILTPSSIARKPVGGVRSVDAASNRPFGLSLAGLYRIDTNRHGTSAPAPGFFGSCGFAEALSGLPTIKRHVFYSFHYDDIVRVNNVRHAEQFKARVLEVPQSHYDRSLWETSRRTNPQSLKAMIRDGIKGTSVVCVLIGSNTFARPWVRYEIARSVIDQKGLLAIDINSITHHGTRTSSPLGPNPLSFMGVGYMSDGTYRLFEKKTRIVDGQAEGVWVRYADHLAAVPLPKYIPHMGVGYLWSLDQFTIRYDAVNNDVWSNLAEWLNIAAVAAGRK